MQIGPTITRFGSGGKEISFSAEVWIIFSGYKIASICASVHEPFV